MKRMTVIATALLSLGPGSVAAAAAADNPVLPNLDLVYDASWGGIGVGSIEVTLKPEGDPGCYRYSTTSHPTALVRTLYGSPNQTSLFCIKDGRIRSQHFESILPGDDKQSYKLDFDWTKLTVTDNNGQVRSIPDDAVDSFALQQAVRLWVLAHAADDKPPVAAFTMVDNKNLTHYQFRFDGHQQVQVPAGTFDTLLMERIDNPQKVGRFWLAPDRSYLPARIETKNGGKPTVQMELLK